MSKVTRESFRRALGKFATGITIITALDKHRVPMGMTVNSFASVSLDPPLVLWSVDDSSPLYDDFSVASHFAVHVLGESQQALSHRFSDDSIDKFDGLDVRRGIDNLPLLDQQLALLQCEVVDCHEAGDHLILVGQVLDIQDQAGNPLLFFSGRYRDIRRDNR